MPDQKRTILLVEDEVIIALTQAALLKKRGYDVILAHDGVSAVATVGSGRRIDLVLMDIDLGSGMDGTEAAAIMLRDHDLPVLFLSSHTEPEIVQKTERITSYGYVAKNSAETIIAASIQMAFRLHRAHRVIRQNHLEIEAVNDELHAAIEELEATNEELIRSQREVMEREQALRESEKLYNNLVETAHDLVWRCDGRGRYIYLNRAWENVFGYRIDEMLGRSFTEFMDRGAAGRDIELFERLMNKDGHVLNYETVHLKKDGNPVYLNFNAVAVKDDSGSVTGIQGTAQDITERKRARLALEKSEEKFSKSFIGSPASLCMSRLKDGIMLEVNDAWLRMTGFSRDEIIGRSVGELSFWVDPNDREKVRNIIINERKVYNQEYNFRIKSGEIHTGLYSAEIIDIDGEAYTLVSIMDLTERKRYEAALAAAIVEKESLLKELHHRVKNSFAIATGIISLEANRRENAEYREIIEDIGRRINSLADLYDILHYEQEVREIRLDHYLDRMGQSFLTMYAADAGRITLVMNLDEIRIDVKRAIPIGLILNELFTNAMKYAFPGRRKGSIEVRLEKNDGAIILSVADNGRGIQSGPDSGKQKGLGMELVRLLVKQLNGTAGWNITKGTTARVTIPVEEYTNERRS